jgi:hypothetical protein
MPICEHCSYVVGDLEVCPECGRATGSPAASPDKKSEALSLVRGIVGVAIAVVALMYAWAGIAMVVTGARMLAQQSTLQIWVPLGTEYVIRGPFDDLAIRLSLNADQSIDAAIVDARTRVVRRVVVADPGPGRFNSGAVRLLSPPEDPTLVAVSYGDTDVKVRPDESGYCVVWISRDATFAGPQSPDLRK